jgi:hypothetical protein
MRWIALGAAALAGACSGPSGPLPEEPPPIEKPRDVRVLWSTNVGRADRFTFFPAPVGDAVYATSREGTVTRRMRRAATCAGGWSSSWRFQAASAPTRAPSPW